MQKSSKIALAIAGILAFVLAAVYIPILIESKPEFTESDGREMLTKLATSLQNESADKTVSYAWEDADVAGRTLKQIHGLLKRGFAYSRNLSVSFGNVRYNKRSDEAVELSANGIGAEVNPQSGQVSETYYSHPVVFTVTRRANPHLLGIFKTYEWKIAKVEAPNLPAALEGP